MDENKNVRVLGYGGTAADVYNGSDGQGPVQTEFATGANEVRDVPKVGAKEMKDDSVYYRQLVVSNRALAKKAQQVKTLRKQKRELMDQVGCLLFDDPEDKKGFPWAGYSVTTSLVLIVVAATTSAFGLTATDFALGAVLFGMAGMLIPE